jgi:hypothetical protein
MTIPMTLADAATAIQDGTLGLIETIAMGDIAVSALISLDGTDELAVTDKPIESGMSIADAAIDIPLERNLYICLANPDFSVESGITAALTGTFSGFAETWRDKKDQLYKYFNDREIISITTHEDYYENMLIQSITPYWDVDENYDAFFARVTIKRITTIEDALTGIIDSPEDAVGGL